MPFPADAESLTAYEEGRSVLGSLITQLIGIIRQMMNFAMNVSKQLITYASENPLALTLAVANICIWMT